MFDFATPKILRATGKVLLTAAERELQSFTELQEQKNAQEPVKLAIRKKRRADKHTIWLSEQAVELAKEAPTKAQKELANQLLEDLEL